MALTQDELNQLATDMTVAIGLDPSLGLKVSNMLAGERRMQEPNPAHRREQLNLFIMVRREMRRDQNFVTALRATPGFPALPPATVAPAAPPAPVGAGVQPNVQQPQVAPPPVVAAPAGPAPGGAAAPAVMAAPSLNATLRDLVERINAGLSGARNPRHTYDTFVSIINGGKDIVHRGEPLDVKLAIQAEQQRAQVAREIFPAAQMIAAINVPAPAVAPQVQQPVVSAQPQARVVVRPPVAQPAAQAAAQPIVQQPPQVAPAAAQGQQPIPAPVAPVAPVVAAPANNTGWPTPLKWVVAILAIIGVLWLTGQFVSAFFTSLVTLEAREQITQRDSQIKTLQERVRVLQGEVNAAIAAMDLAQTERREAQQVLARLRRDYDQSEIPTLREQLAKATTELESLKPEVADLRKQLATAGRTAREAETKHGKVVAQHRGNIAALIRESEQMNGLIRQLQDPSNIGAPCTVDILTLNVTAGSNTELKIHRWGEDRDQVFSVPGAGDRQFGRCTKVYNTSGGIHLFSVGGIQRQKLIVPAEMTVYVRYGTSGRWQPHSFNRATILVIGGDASLEYRDPDLAELAARR